MPNWTKNEVTFTSAKTTNIKKIKEIFKKGSPFNQLIQEPKWDEIPLKGNEKTSDFRKTLYGMKGEFLYSTASQGSIHNTPELYLASFAQ